MNLSTRWRTQAGVQRIIVSATVTTTSTSNTTIGCIGDRQSAHVETRTVRRQILVHFVPWCSFVRLKLHCAKMNRLAVRGSWKAASLRPCFIRVLIQIRRSLSLGACCFGVTTAGLQWNGLSLCAGFGPGKIDRTDPAREQEAEKMQPPPVAVQINRDGRKVQRDRTPPSARASARCKDRSVPFAPPSCRRAAAP